MTSEVAVMNRLAVALAADSAATVTSGTSRKIWNSANKLFALSKCHPVGVMVYNGASILGVPWETIIKMYRVHLAERHFPTLIEYGQNFVEFLNGHPRLFPLQVQRSHFANRFTRALIDLHEQTKGHLADAQDAATPIVPAPSLLDLLEQRIDATLLDIEKLDPVSTHEVHTEAAVEADLGPTIDSVIHQFAMELQTAFSNELRQKMHQLAIVMVTRSYFGLDYTGIVFAGFGEDEHFPVLHSFMVGGVVLGTLRCSAAETKSISDDTPSIVQPFAQSQMVDTFLQGVNPSFRDKIIRSFLALADEVPKQIIEQITDLDAAQKAKWAADIGPTIYKHIQNFFGTFDQHFRSNYWDPVHQALVHLPKDELAEVAEALVNLNSFQQRVSLDDETVGGPIDVAVISKGDGLVWIKRKHYFSRELNEHYFNNVRRQGIGHV